MSSKGVGYSEYLLFQIAVYIPEFNSVCLSDNQGYLETLFIVFESC